MHLRIERRSYDGCKPQSAWFTHGPCGADQAGLAHKRRLGTNVVFWAMTRRNAAPSLTGCTDRLRRITKIVVTATSGSFLT